ncbi:hypothetical protein LEP1GSC029_4356 [Leptospira interrogans str. 2002000626]|uniref:Uncharacterized protein n=1 Tax=Leptospira interrogans str. 2002000626 TaxID=996803 RepID=A0A829CYJ1_LEPIR|nr:hypothetical protein LEP1GSC029_4356 [Leptospira interrogans str. 2002000626]
MNPLNRLRESLHTILDQTPNRLTTIQVHPKSKNYTTDIKSDSLFQKILNVAVGNSNQTTDSMLNLQKKITDFQKKAEELENKIHENRIDLKV